MLCLGKNGFDDTGWLNSGQSVIQSLELVAKPLVINAKEMQQRGMQITYDKDVLDGVLAELIRCSFADPPLDASTGHPH